MDLEVAFSAFPFSRCFLSVALKSLQEGLLLLTIAWRLEGIKTKSSS